MTHRPLPGRVAYRPLPTLANPPGRPTADIPPLWPNLSPATQAQIAQIVATLLRRMQAVTVPRPSPPVDGRATSELARILASLVVTLITEPAHA